MGVRKFRSIEDMNIADEIRRAAKATLGLRLLVLHGSRATGKSAMHSDWDFAFIGELGLDVNGLQARLGEAAKSDSIDLADLDRASGLLRFNAASDGFAVFEREPGAFRQFRLDAISAWLDMAAVLGPAYEARLERLAK